MNDRPRIAVCFFGISRAAKITAPALEKNILSPLRGVGDVTVFAHLYDQTHVVSPRNGEDVKIPPDDWKLLPVDIIERETPEASGADRMLDAVKPFGDAFDNDFSSTRNLVRQLYSLRRAFELSQAQPHDVWIFIRPDLLYHDSILPAFLQSLKAAEPHARIPRWQHAYRGYNDRFSICVGEKAAGSYANRINDAMAYCEHAGPLHSELLLKYALRRHEVSVRLMSLRASRVRATGDIVQEDFRDWRHREAVRLSLLYSIQALRAIGLWQLLRPTARKIFKSGKQQS